MTPRWNEHTLIAFGVDLSEGTAMVTTEVLRHESSTDDDRYTFVKQYSLARILAVWAAAAIPMGVLAWVVAPWMREHLGGREPFAQALLICLTAGLIWQFVLVLILMRSELGTLEWSRLRDALWLRSPRHPKTGKVGGKTWWWAGLFAFLGLVWALVPQVPGPSIRDFGDFLSSDRGEAFFHGAWGWWAVVVVFCVFNTVIGEELLFRGVLLPRMRDAFGKADWVANGLLFTVYHLHQPWSMPGTLVEGIFLEAYPSRRFQSAWIGIIVHSLQSVFITLVVLGLVLK
jgi:membrane protease YdiL (CAAX protease family)